MSLQVNERWLCLGYVTKNEKARKQLTTDHDKHKSQGFRRVPTRERSPHS
jgi:hypothetical protein